MKSWFWPGLTWTATLTALALWFGGERVETDIGNRTADALSSYVWAGFDVDGRDVTLKGTAPDPEAQDAARLAVQGVAGINDVTDLTSVLPVASPYIFKVEKNADGLVLSGFIPDNAVRDQLMDAAQAIVANASVDDEMALARGFQPEFTRFALFSLQLAQDFSAVQVQIADQTLSVRGNVASEEARRKVDALLAGTLPGGLKLVAAEISGP